LSGCRKFRMSISGDAEPNSKKEEPDVPVSEKSVPVASEQIQKKKIQTKLHPFIGKMTPKEKSKLDEKVTRLIYCNNLPFSLVDSKEFKELMACASKGSYIPPSRKQIGETFLENAYEQTKQDIHLAVKGCPVTIA